MALGVRLISVLLACGAAGCALVAREHACWPFLAHQYHDQVPAELVHTLAHEHGTRRRVGRYPAPSGYYWRRHRGERLDVQDIRTLVGDYELARCPNAIVPDATLPRTR